MAMAKFRLLSGSKAIEQIAIKLGIHNYIAVRPHMQVHVVLRQHGWYGQTRDLSHVMVFSRPFWATVCETVRRMLSDRCPVGPILSVCNVDVMRPNGWMDQDQTWRAGRPRP